MSLKRRDLLRGSTNTCHISSLVVQCRPDTLASAITAVEKMPHLEVPASDAGGKFVALLETESESDILQGITSIEALPGVINVTLAYHHIDDE